MLFGAGEAVAVALKGLLHKVTLCVEHGQQHITIQHAVVVNLGAPANGGGGVIVGGLDVKGRHHTRLDEVLNHLVKDFRALVDRHGESQGNGLGLVADHGIAQTVDFLGVDGGLALKLLGHQHGVAGAVQRHKALSKVGAYGILGVHRDFVSHVSQSSFTE